MAKPCAVWALMKHLYRSEELPVFPPGLPLFLRKNFLQVSETGFGNVYHVMIFINIRTWLSEELSFLRPSLWGTPIPTVG